MSSGSSPYKDGSYAAAHPSWHVEDSEWKAMQILQLLRRNDLSPSEVCEVGCGAGEILNCLRRELPSTTRFFGYEISDAALELCASLADDQLSFHHADLLKQEVFHEVVCCIDVIEHVADYLGFLRDLRPRGEYKVFHVPLEITMERLFRGQGFVSVRRKYGHLHHFTSQTLLASLEDTGYEVLDWFYTPSELVLPIKSLGQAIARLPRKLVFAVSKGFAARATGGISLIVLAK